MAKKKDTTYLLRSIPRDLWGRVKAKAYQKGLTVRQYIVGLLEKDTKTWQESETEKKQKEL